MKPSNEIDKGIFYTVNQKYFTDKIIVPEYTEFYKDDGLMGFRNRLNHHRLKDAYYTYFKYNKSEYIIDVYPDSSFDVYKKNCLSDISFNTKIYMFPKVFYCVQWFLNIKKMNVVTFNETNVYNYFLQNKSFVDYMYNNGWYLVDNQFER
jgi:hypothetical protein